ncbi:uncharacterized protein C18orf63-like [Pogonomyrmex barbatus]|uniref:Uncharacterized protein C18orf63-like n=1 Tax=Pogonomyrmex barbatus TaxID=144034 RepID=A0A6I9WFP2_9HYME|nr:uncharacterized protein C18orf63-like [Pogonomyrmex barbatus]
MVSTVKIFNIIIPRKDDLCCAICKIMNSENDPLIYSNYCRKNIKCRQLLQETPQAMAAPITNRKLLETGSSLYVISTKEFFKSCTFRDHLDALNIQVMDLLDPVPIYIYKSCLLYTVEYKLAPQWNKVGMYLVEGDFLTSTGSVNAITLNIKDIRDNNAHLHVEASNLKIPFLRLKTTRSSQHDLQSPVRVLPSMKMANILSVSKRIGEKFKTYENLRAYWKNMYGYMLPDYEEGFLFYNVEFFYFKSSIFIYPEMCLASGPLEILPPAMDPVSRIYKFVGDLRGRVTKLCEQQLDVFPEDMYQAAILACTPMLPKVDKFSDWGTGYGTGSRRIRNVMPRMFDTCDIPTKQSRLSLSGINKSVMCKTEIDLDFGINPTNNFNKVLKTTDTISTMLYDNAVTDKSVVQKDESKSNYFKQKEEKFESNSLVEMANKEEKPKKQSLKEKLLRNF